MRGMKPYAHRGTARAHTLDFLRGIGARRRSCGAALDEPLERTRDVLLTWICSSF